MVMLADGENNYNCQEGSRFPSADRLITLQTLIVNRQEDAEMGRPKITRIPTLCVCGCNEVVWNGHKYVQGHNLNVFVEGNQINKGRNPWNKGLSNLPAKIHSKKTIQKIINSNRGQIRSDITRKNISNACKGKTPWNKGLHWSENVRKKISLNNGSKYLEVREKISVRMKGKFCGKDNPSWNGGVSFLPYCYKFNKQLKERIRDRDSHICQLCETKENGKRLHVHHIHYDKENCAPDLISLCNKCNSKVNFNRDYWESYFMNLLSKT